MCDNVRQKLGHTSVGGVMSIAAFQAVDPGSIPGRRNTFVFSNVFFIPSKILPIVSSE